MKKIIFNLTASSREELRAKIAGQPIPPSSYITLAISGPQVLTRTFAVKNLQDLPEHLQREAVELLSRPADEIIIASQILAQEEQKISGVFVCIPKRLALQYLHILNLNRPVAVKVTTQLLARLDAFIRTHKDAADQFCFFDLSVPQKLSVVVFSGKRCELIREISYETREELKMQMLQSLRNALASAREKRLDHVFFYGDVADQDQLVAEMESKLEVEITAQNAALAEEKVSNPDEDFWKINLVQNYVIPLEVRQKILLGLNAGLTVLGAGFVVLSVLVIMKMAEIKKLQSSYTQADYTRAVKLGKQLGSLK